MLKNTFSILGLCLVLCLGACNKENLPDGDGDSHNEPLVIKLAFASTRTVLDPDGKTPKFQEGDTIAVFDNSGIGAHLDDCIVAIDKNGIATITIDNPPEDVQNLQLIYPSDCYSERYDKRSGKNIYSTRIPANQDGTFRRANICTADKYDYASGSATFHLAESLLKFDLTSHTDIKQLLISGDDEKHGLNDDGATDQYGYSLTTVTFSDKVSERIYYVAINPQNNTTIYIDSIEPKYSWTLYPAFFDNKRIYPITLIF